MTQDRASGCVCASLSLVGQPTPIRPSTSPAASSTQDHWLPVSVVSLADPQEERLFTNAGCSRGLNPPVLELIVTAIQEAAAHVPEVDLHTVEGDAAAPAAHALASPLVRLTQLRQSLLLRRPRP